MYTELLYKIPSNPVVFDGFQSVLVTRCVANAADWNLPPALVADMVANKKEWDAAYDIAANRKTSSPAATAARNALLLVYRSLVDKVMHDYIVGNESVSEQDKTAMGIHARSRTRSLPSEPSTVPVLLVDNRFVSAHRFRFHDSATPHSRKRPDSAAYCEIWYRIDGPPPSDPSETKSRVSVTRSGQNITYDNAYKGKYVYYYARWVNRKGELGPWSDMVGALVI